MVGEQWWGAVMEKQWWVSNGGGAMVEEKWGTSSGERAEVEKQWWGSTGTGGGAVMEKQ